MTRLQKAQLKQSQLRSEIAEELDKNEEERTDGLLDSLSKDLQAAEVEIRAALLIEEEISQPDEVIEAGTPEHREMVELRSRVDFGKYVEAALQGSGVVAGPEAELNQELGLRSDYFPLDILAGEWGGQVETRAKRDGDAQANQQTWIDRVFANTAAERVGVTMRSVNPGVAAIPLTAAGGEPVQRGREEAVSESTYTFNVTELKPGRGAVHGIYSIEDDLRLPGMSDAIERDMRAAMTEKIDRIIFVGDAGANEANADITGLQTAGINETTITQANKVKGPETLMAFANMVDGIYASMISDLRVVTAVGAYRLWETTIANAAAENQTLAGFLRAAGLTWTSRGGIETDTANGDFGAFVGLPNGIEGAAVAAVWNQGQLIRDPYSTATKGEVQLTLNYFWNFAIPRTANFKRIKFVT